MGLGPFSLVSLADARVKAMQHRLQLLAGENPVAARRTTQAQALHYEAVKTMSFQACAAACIADKRPGWKSAKHADQWTNTLATYAYPHIGMLDVKAIDTGLVRKCLDPIWTTKTETASRVRQRIEAVLDWAKVHGYRSGDNPASWRGHLEAVMAAPTKIARPANHASLAYTKVGAFVADLRKHPGVAALALEFTIRTACRTAEVVQARRSEIDRKANIWTIPASRMKAGIAHTVPLDSAMLQLIDRAAAFGPVSLWLFPGGRQGQPLSTMAMLQLIRGMGTTDDNGESVTVHGFRATFRQWAAETTSYSGELAEHALAHRLRDKTEAAYQRSSLLEKRRALMTESPRELWRLQPLRRWSHEQVEQVLT